MVIISFSHFDLDHLLSHLICRSLLAFIVLDSLIFLTFGLFPCALTTISLVSRSLWNGMRFCGRPGLLLWTIFSELISLRRDMGRLLELFLSLCQCIHLICCEASDECFTIWLALFEFLCFVLFLVRIPLSLVFSQEIVVHRNTRWVYLLQLKHHYSQDFRQYTWWFHHKF